MRSGKQDTAQMIQGKQISRVNYGLHKLCRDGVPGTPPRLDLGFEWKEGGFDGVTGRSVDGRTGSSPSALLRNCRGVRGEPFFEGVESIERGLPLLGLPYERGENFGSGVRGG
jgi:hypothetical protein